MNAGAGPRNIGITYDLREEYLALGYGEEETAEFDRPSTIEAIEGALRSLGHRTDRIGNIGSLTRRLAGGERWDLVFNIAEGLRGVAREAQVPALLDAHGIAYTGSDPLVCALALDKALTKRVVRDLGVPTPEFAMVTCEADISRVALPFPLFAKPYAEGTSKGVTSASKIVDRPALERQCVRLLREFRQPVLVERYLPGREVTVGVLGTGENARSLGVLEVVLLGGADPDVYTYDNKEMCEERVKYVLASDAFARDAADLALRVWRGLGCRDAGRVDVRADERGRPSFIEVNPLSGMHPEHSDLPILAGLTGMTYRELIAVIVASASERIVDDDRPVPGLAAVTGAS